MERMKKDITEWLAAMGRIFSGKEQVDAGRSLQRTFALARAVAVTQEVRDTYKEGHQFRVSDLARALGEETGLEEERITGLKLAALIHDVGKIGIPSEILNKKSRLAEAENRVMQTHVELGYGMLKGVPFPWPVARMVREHHERMDGSGYPRGLRGDDILLESRILAVADVADAITSRRAYRPAREIYVALYSMKGDRGAIYDQDIVDACLRLFEVRGYKMLDLD
jgi:HD-GYP domain-containing protein (c-di-GMP phosphodiesterase class II)